MGIILLFSFYFIVIIIVYYYYYYYDQDGRTPLHAAANRGFSEIVKILLERGADLNKTDLVIVYNNNSNFNNFNYNFNNIDNSNNNFLEW